MKKPQVALSFAIITLPLVMAANTVGAIAQDASGYIPKIALVQDKKADAELHLTKWSQVPWTGDDQPYDKLMKTIDSEIAKNLPTSYFVSKYHTSAVAHPQDPLAQFADAYSIYKQTPRFNGSKYTQYVLYQEGAMELANAPFPATYQYAHLRFIMETSYKPRIELRWLGDRLLARNPEDERVKWDYVSLMLTSSANFYATQHAPTAADDKLTLSYINDLIKVDPGNYGSLGLFYTYRYDRTHNLVDATKALAALKRSVAVLPENDIDKHWCDPIIADLQKHVDSGH